MDRSSVKAQESATCPAAQLQFWFNEGMDHLKHGRWRPAVEAFENILIENPDSASSCCNLGIALMQLKNWGLAGNAMRRYVALVPDDIMGHIRLGIILRELNYPSKSVRSLRQALKLNDRSALAWNQLGHTFLSMNKKDQARESYVNALRIKPDYLRARSSLAELYEQLNMPGMAIEIYKQGLAATPRDRLGELHLKIGRLMGRLGLWSDARVHLEKAARLSEVTEDLIFDLGSACLHVGDKAAAGHLAHKLETMQSELGRRLRQMLML